MTRILLDKMVGKLGKRKKGGKELIIEMVLAVVGVALAFVFRTQITDLISKLGTSMSDKIQSIFTTL